MQKKWIVWGVVALAVIWIVASVVSSYNGMVTARREIDGKWGQVQVVLQRRMDLVPNLVATAKGAAKIEKETLENIAAARSGLTSAISSGDRGAQVQAAQKFDNVMYQFRVAVEAYPQLASQAGFRDLMTELAGTENRISVERKRYNDAVTDYNKLISVFPKNIIAGAFGFSAEKQYSAPTGADKAPVVNLDLK